MIENLGIDIITLIITVDMAVIGWLVALFLQEYNIKQQHKVQIQYDIYKQFVQIHKDIQDTLGKLGACICLPFITMESSMIPFNLKLKKWYKDVWLPYGESECVFEGERKWASYVQGIKKNYSEFSSRYISLLYIFEDWATAFGSLTPIKDILFREIGGLQKSINTQSDFLQMYSINHGSDWRKWDREEIKKIADSIQKDAYGVGFYLNDFMVIVHNKLLSNYFKLKRPTRITLDPKYKVLTMNGIIENVDWKKVERMKVYKSKLITIAREKLDEVVSKENQIIPEYEVFLRLIINGICPDCKNPIEVVNMEESKDGFCFHYTCGHSWQGVVTEHQQKN